MSRQLRRQVAMRPGRPVFARGELWGWATRGNAGRSEVLCSRATLEAGGHPWAISDAEAFALEVRNGELWPTLGPDKAIATLRGGPRSSPDGSLNERILLWKGLLTPAGHITRKGHEALYYLTRVYL